MRTLRTIEASEERARRVMSKVFLNGTKYRSVFLEVTRAKRVLEWVEEEKLERHYTSAGTPVERGTRKDSLEQNVIKGKKSESRSKMRANKTCTSFSL